MNLKIDVTVVVCVFTEFFKFILFYFFNLFINTKLHLQIKILEKRKVYTTAFYLWYFYKFSQMISHLNDS